jgi:hypothetical protein
MSAIKIALILSNLLALPPMLFPFRSEKLETTSHSITFYNLLNR